MSYAQNPLSLHCDFSTAAFYDEATGGVPVLWRGQALRLRVGVFQGPTALGLTDVTSVTATLMKTPTEPVAAASRSSTTVTPTFRVADWLSEDAQHVTIDFTAADLDVGLGAQNSAFYWLAIQGLTSTGAVITLAAGGVDIRVPALQLPLPPWGYVSYEAQANSSGNSSLTPTSFQHTAALTFTGAAGTRLVVLPTVGMNPGARISLLCVLPATPGVVVDVRNGTLSGTSLSLVTTDTFVRSAAFDYYFDGAAWQPFRHTIPAL